MPSKRRSLADIVDEDNRTTAPGAAPKLQAVPKKAEPSTRKSAPEVKSEIGFLKSDFIKMSVTVPPDVFESLQDLSRQRRRAKKPHTMSDLVRDALGSWLSKQN